MKSLKESLFDGDLVSKNIKFTFAGLEINPMPVIYKHGKFQSADSWDELSYKKVFGLKEGSTYFNWDQCHDVKIDKWRLPSQEEWEKIINRGLHEFIIVDGEDAILIYPDNYVKKVKSKRMTKKMQKEYIEQGCIFLPNVGYHSTNLNWYETPGYSWTSTQCESLGNMYAYLLGWYIYPPRMFVDIKGDKQETYSIIMLVK